MIIYHHLPQGTSAPQGTTTGPREKRFLASLIPTNQDQEAPLWTWIKNLFSGAAAELQETSQLLTPLENDVWTATTILEVISKTRTKRETSESPSAVSKLMKWLQLAVLGPRTLLTPLDDKEFLQNLNRTTESPRNTTPSPIDSTRTRRDPDDLHGSMGLLVVIMTAFLVTCCAGIAICHRRQEDQNPIMEHQSVSSITDYSIPFGLYPEDDLPSYEEAAAPPAYEDAIQMDQIPATPYGDPKTSGEI